MYLSSNYCLLRTKKTNKQFKAGDAKNVVFISLPAHGSSRRTRPIALKKIDLKNGRWW